MAERHRIPAPVETMRPVRPQYQHPAPAQHYGRKHPAAPARHLRRPAPGAVSHRQQCEPNRILGQHHKGHRQSRNR